MTDEELQELRRLHERATPGPWEASENYLIGGWWIQNEEQKRLGREAGDLFKAADASECELGDFFGEADSRFAATAYNVWPRLLDEIERLKSEVGDRRSTAEVRKEIINELDERVYQLQKEVGQLRQALQNALYSLGDNAAVLSILANALKDEAD